MRTVKSPVYLYAGLPSFVVKPPGRSMNSAIPLATLADRETFASPLDFPDSPLSQAFAQPILLGLFLPIQAGGWSASTLPRSTDWRFDYNKDLVLKAEDLGFDLVFALSP